MDKYSSYNIFNEAAKGNRSKSKAKTSKELPLEKDGPQPKTPSNLDISTLLERMAEMRQDLDKKTDDLKEAMALSKIDVSKFFSDPRNFTKEQWEIIEQTRSDFEKRTWALIGKDPKKERKKQKEEKDTKSRKGKTLGSRKNWISLR